MVTSFVRGSGGNAVRCLERVFCADGDCHKHDPDGDIGRQRRDHSEFRKRGDPDRVGDCRDHAADDRPSELLRFICQILYGHSSARNRAVDPDRTERQDGDAEVSSGDRQPRLQGCICGNQDIFSERIQRGVAHGDWRSVPEHDDDSSERQRK